jgi:hypothetical protein
MTVKDQLEQIIRLHKAINRKLAQRRALQDLATHTTSVYSDMPKQKTLADPVGHLVQRMVDLEAEVDADIDLLADMKAVVQLWFAGLADARQRNVMELRYIECLEWSQVAQASGYSARRAYQLHEAAIETLQSISVDYSSET